MAISWGRADYENQEMSDAIIYDVGSKGQTELRKKQMRGACDQEEHIRIVRNGYYLGIYRCEHEGGTRFKLTKIRRSLRNLQRFSYKENGLKKVVDKI